MLILKTLTLQGRNRYEHKEREDTVNTPSLKAKNQLCSHTIIAINKLQEIRDIALYNAMKCRWDPTLSDTHEQYLTLLNNLLKHQENL